MQNEQQQLSEIDTPEHPRMPIGKYRGQLVSAMTTTFLAWFISQDNLRVKYSALVLDILAELRARFQVAGQVEAELLRPDISDLV